MHNSFSVVVVSLLLGLWPAATGSAQSAASDGTAPTIIFAASPALLVRIDGDPVYRHVAGTSLQRIVNTKPLILRDETGAHYLKILDGWMEAYSLEDWWSIAGVPPAGADVALSEAVAAKDVDLLDDGQVQGSGDGSRLTNRRQPAIYISTTPAVLVVTEGPPRFAAVPGTSLEYIENTTAKVFREPTDQELYVWVSGRWFRSWRTEGPWQFIPANQLPADFAKIPESRLRSNPGGLK
jgi:hypothetical protein